MLRLILATAGLLLMCSVLCSCDSGGGDASKYADEMPEKGPDPVRVPPIQAPGATLEASSQQGGGGGG